MDNLLYEAVRRSLNAGMSPEKILEKVLSATQQVSNRKLYAKSLPIYVDAVKQDVSLENNALNKLLKKSNNQHFLCNHSILSPYLNEGYNVYISRVNVSEQDFSQSFDLSGELIL